MSQPNSQVEAPWLTPAFFENRHKFPLDELNKYSGKHIAWSWDGTRIVASADSLEALFKALDDAGIPISHVVGDYIPAEDEDTLL